MKILFIENRYKTSFWRLIAEELSKDGHEISWLVQNHSFKPGFGKEYLLPYFKPSKAVKDKNYTADLTKIISSNRGINYFRIKSDDFIFYYQEQIEKLIDRINPDVVFGESTLFHELLTAEAAKKRGILYLHPTGARYPIDRFVFYKYDTTDPLAGGTDKLEDKDITDRITEIITGNVKPVYMLKGNNKWLGNKLQKITHTLSYYWGEKYNTPSPFVKVDLEKQKDISIAKWENFVKSKQGTIEGKMVLLFPLHMQPEANIDVWGNKYRNQAKLLADVASGLPSNTVLLIKPNPKSKYELTDELMTTISANENLIPLAHNSSMKDVLKSVNMALTINGTIALECIFKNIPVVTLIQSYFNKPDNCRYVEDISELNRVIDSVANGTFPKLTMDEMIAYYRYLHSISYKGLIGDWIAGPHYILEANIKNVIAAFKEILLKVATKNHTEVQE
jgi:hypothetical protein